ncbi:MAG: hypothetical protein ACK4PR_01975 [Gammaproteobacteria bacterium]
MASIVILSSTRQELKFFFNYFTDLKPIIKNGITFLHGTLAKHDIFLAIAGIGMVNSAVISTLAVQQLQPALLIFCGVAGGVNSSVNIGDVVITSEVGQPELLTLSEQFAGTPFYEFLEHPHKQCMQPNWLPAIKFKPYENKFADFTVHTGRIASSDQFPSPQKEYALLLDSHVLAIDMETSALFQAGWVTNTPTLAVRGISNCLLEDGTDPDMHHADIEQAPLRAAQVCMDLITTFVEQAN